MLTIVFVNMMDISIRNCILVIVKYAYKKELHLAIE